MVTAPLAPLSKDTYVPSAIRPYRSVSSTDDESFPLDETCANLIDFLMRDTKLQQRASCLGPGLAFDRRCIAVCIEIVTAFGLAHDEFGVVVENGAGCRSAYA